MPKHLLGLVAALLFAAAEAGTPPASPPVDPGVIAASASSTFFPSLTDAFLTIDGSGMQGDVHDNHAQGHGMWLSASGGGGSALNNPAGVAGPAWLRYDFTTAIDLEAAWVWNHNQSGLTSRGLRNVSVHVSPDGTAWSLLGDFEFAQAPGTSGYAHSDELDFGMQTVKSVLITAKSSGGNYGDLYYGFSEIRFYGEGQQCVPEDYPVQVESVAIDPVYADLLLPQAVGWLGSDVAHSIPMSDDRVIWLFADTLLGTIVDGARTPGGFINSSIGIHDRTDGPAGSVTYHWGAGDTSFFPHEPGTPGELYWPTQGIHLGGDLFLFCFSVATGFQLESTTMIRVDNPDDDPGDWTWTVSDFGIGGNDFGVHSAVYVEGPYVYFMGFEDTGGRRMILSRMLAADLVAGSMAEALEFWADEGSGPQWSTTAAPSQLVTLFTPGVTETDIQYDATLERYFVTTYDPFTPRIYLTTAEELTGPWEEPVCLYDVPEHDVSFPIISYAVRPHPELSTKAGELVITYATNGFGSLGALYTQEGLGIYHPRFIRVQLEVDPLAVDLDAWTIE